MMNRVKKLLSMLLAVMMLLGMMQFAAFAEDIYQTSNAVITLTDNVEGTLKPGNTFKVIAKIANNPGYHTAGFAIVFNTAALKVTGYDCEEYYFGDNGTCNTNAAYGAFINTASASAKTKDRDLFELTFEVLDGAASGEYEIKIDDQNPKHEFVRQADDNPDNWIVWQDVTYVSTKVTVEGNEPVKPDAPIQVTGIELNKTALEFTLSSETLSETLTATVLPENAENKAVVWSTSNAGVATVENGVVTAVGEGTAIITVTTADGGFKAECAVKVNPEPKTMNGDHADMAVSSNLVTAGDTVQMKISVENDQNNASEYNSYEFVVGYDSANLTYNGFSCDADENCAVVKKGGKLIVNGYGDIKTVSEDAFVILNFVARNSGEENVTANVYLEEAYRDTSEMAIERDIDDIEIENSSKTITIQPTTKEYKVTFSEYVMVNGEKVNEKTVKAGESVTFSVIEQTGMDASVTGATKNDDGTYTVTPTEDTTVTIEHKSKTYSVTVKGTGKDDVTYETKATHGKEYTFTVTEESGYNYEVSATVGGKDVTLSGSYTIAAADVTGNIVINVSKTEKPDIPTPETYTVTVYKNGVQDSTDTATEGVVYNYTVAEGFRVTGVTVSNVAFTGYTLTDSVLNIPAGSVNGNIKIYLGGIYNVTLPGADTPEDETDDTVTGAPEANYGTDYTFTVDEGYEPTVTIGGKPADITDNGDGSYTIPGDKITGDIVITTAKIVYTESVNVYPYVKADGATVIQLVVATANDKVAGDEILQYNGVNMFWSSKYDGYAYLVLVGEDEGLLTKEDAAAKISVAKASATEISYNGNVNMTDNDVKDVNDAQLVYDIYKAMYSDFDKVSMEKMLRADMNANADEAEATYGITVNDAAAVVAIVNAK